jgi:hypothetical protein
MVFLLHKWEEVMNYSKDVMGHAVEREAFFGNFFHAVKGLVRSVPVQAHAKWGAREKQLFDRYAVSFRFVFIFLLSYSGLYVRLVAIRRCGRACTRRCRRTSKRLGRCWRWASSSHSPTPIYSKSPIQR